MVRLLSLLIFILISNLAFGVEFKARTSKKIYHINDEIELTLTLTEIDKYSEPNITSLLASGFKITSNNMNIKTTIINGSYKKEVTWYQKYISDKLGKVKIPKITIQADNKIYETNELEIEITKEKVENTEDTTNQDIVITSSLNKYDPYIGESLIYKLQVIRFIDIYNEFIIAPKSNNAVIKQIDSEKNYNKIIDNKDALISEYFFQIIPTTEKLEIEPAIIQGKILTNKNYDPFANFGSFIRFKSANEYQDVIKKSQKFTLNVKNKNNSTLALEDINITVEHNDKDNYYIGDPINFTIKIKANNIDASQLPQLNIKNNPHYKIYAEKPQLETKLDQNNNKLFAHKTINYTFISYQAGEIEVPLETIAWFDVNKKRLTKVNPPLIKFNISEVEEINNINPTNKKEKNLINHVNESVIEKKSSNYLLIISLILNIIFIFKEIFSKYKKPPAAASKKTYKISIKKILNANDATELYQLLSSYFKEYHDINNFNLANLEKYLKTITKYNNEGLLREIALLEAVIYGKEKFDLNKSKKTIKILLKKLPKKKGKKIIRKEDLNLNP
jgi:hypothetical protein